MSDLMDKHTKTGKWYIDGVTTAGTTIASDGMYIGKVIDEHLAETIVTAVNGRNEREALLKVEQALRAIYNHKTPLPDDVIDIARTALSLLDEARK